jgi:DNA-binding beta-propeller fold protein YncE
MPASPLGLALSRDQTQLYVTCAAPLSMICLVDIPTRRITHQIPAGHTAMSPVLSPDGKVLYVCDRFDDKVAAIDLASRETLWRAVVRREPVAAAITPDGKLLLVANHLHSGRSDGGVIGAVVSVIDTATGCTVKEVQLPRGSSLLRGIAISPDGRFAAVTHLVARYYLPTTEVGLGRINANALSLIDLKRLEWIRLAYLDQAEQGAANPWAIGWTADGQNIVVTHAGTHELSVMEAPRFPQKPSPIRFRVALPGEGPRALAFAGTRVFVANYFTDNLAVIDLAEPNAPAQALELGSTAEISLARKGEAHFNDARLCSQGWQSCASCHDADGRIDGLNWDLLNDGSGNPKNAKSLLWAHLTPPAMALGVRADAESAVRAGFERIQFTQPPEAVALAVDEYLRSLQPIPGPFTQNRDLCAAAERGRALFVDGEVGCARCHPEPLFTDLNRHDVGTTGHYDSDADRFDTPTLVELWRTAPYLHDGSAASLREVLTTRNRQDEHGKTSHLTDRQIEDLVIYLLTLP